MEALLTIPVWLLCAVIFALRVADVTLGTMRTISIVKGHITPAMVLGFFELLIWITAISQVITRLSESWWLALAYASGFAVGNGVGLTVERWTANGAAVVRIMSAVGGSEIADRLRRDGYLVTSFAGDGGGAPMTLVYAMAPRRRARQIIEMSREVDPDLVYVVDPAHETNGSPQLRLRPVPHATGWRAAFKKK